MKKFISILLLSCMFFSITGCSNGNLKTKYDTTLEDKQKNNLESEKDIGKEHVYDAEEVLVPKKTTVTEVVYQEVLPYLDNRIVVKQAGLYGIIDNLGNIVMPITQPYEIQPMTNDTAVLIDSGKYGILSLNGEVLVPAIYDGIDVINEDLILLQNLNIATENNLFNPTTEDYIDTINKFYSVKNRNYLDLEIVGYIGQIIVGQNFFVIDYSTREKYNIKKIITFDGRIININYDIPSEHYYLDVTGSGVISMRFKGTIYKTSNNHEYLISQKYLIDMQGNIIIDFSNEDSHFVFDNTKDFCFSDEVIVSQIVKKEGIRKYYNHYIFNLKTNEKKKIDVLSDNILVTDVFSNGFYEINIWPEGESRQNYYGLMNDRYEVIVEPVYDSIEDCVNGYFPVKLNEYWGYADEFGNVLPPQFEDDKIQKGNEFAYNYVSDYNGGLIHPKTGGTLPYRKVDHIDFKYSDCWMCLATLTDDETGEEYKSFVTWDGPIVEHKFPNDQIKVSNDGKVAVYNKGTLYTIVELQ